jgi:uncharacterized protein
MTKNPEDTFILLTRLVEALERLAPPLPHAVDLTQADAFVWNNGTLQPVFHVNAIELSLLKGIERVRDQLLENTRRFSQGLPANNALLWGARGMGKSSLVKAVHGHLNTQSLLSPLKLIEIHKEDIETLPLLMSQLRSLAFSCLILCDDLSFDAGDSSYKALKTALEGGLEGRPQNVLFYATSNRRHLMPRDMIENERSTAIHAHESVEEKVSLSDRFGLWLGFHACSQEEYLEMVESYVRAFALPIAPETLRHEALEWAITRGNRSGRTSWQFIQDLAGRLGVKFSLDQRSRKLLK